MVLNVVGSSPICHPQEKRKIGNGSPLFLLYDTQSQKRKAQTALHHLRLLSVIPLRFERRTHALEGRCSIQLSYGTNLF